MAKPILVQLFKAAARPTKIFVGGNEVARLCALVGQSDLTAETDEGVVVVGKSVNFFYLPEEFIDPDGNTIATDAGTEIHRQIGNKIHIHEVLPRDQAQPKAEIGPDIDLVRVHTRLLRTIDA